MNIVKNPVLLDASLTPVEMLKPTKGTLNLKMCGTSEASLTLPLGSPDIAMHQWIQLFNVNGFVGYYRRTSNSKGLPTDQSLSFRHGIDILADSIYVGEIEFTGTKTQYLTALLNQQTSLINGVKPWVLGTCADSSTITKKIDHENLLDLFQALEDEGGDYYFTYDQTVFPWVVSYVAKSSAVASEFRLQRNAEKIRISDNDSELCTRLVLGVNSMMDDAQLGVKQNKTLYRVYDNATAQAAYGIVVKTEDIDTTDSVPYGPFPQADAFAAKYLADRAEPIVTVQIDGTELYRQTGDHWDEAQLGTLCRVALPDYATYIAQRVVSVSYPDLYGISDRVTVQLSNALPKTIKDSTLTGAVSANAKAARKGGGASRKAAREAENFIQHFQITDENGNILKQAGLRLDANGMLVYADDNVNMVGARFNVQADKIGMVVGENQDGNYIKAGEIALSINGQTGESKVLLQADIIDIEGVVEALESYDISCGTLTAGTITGQNIDADSSMSTPNLYVGPGEFPDTRLSNSGIECPTVECTTLKVGSTPTTASWQTYAARFPTLGTRRYFLYSAASGDLNPSGTARHYPITSYTDTTIHYLGSAST